MMILLAGIFEGGVGILIYSAIILVLWYGGKLVHENATDPAHANGVTPGILTGMLGIRKTYPCNLYPVKANFNIC